MTTFPYVFSLFRILPPLARMGACYSRRCSGPGSKPEISLRAGPVGTIRTNSSGRIRCVSLSHPSEQKTSRKLYICAVFQLEQIVSGLKSRAEVLEHLRTSRRVISVTHLLGIGRKEKLYNQLSLPEINSFIAPLHNAQEADSLSVSILGFGRGED